MESESPTLINPTKGCISDTRAIEAKYLGLQNNINRLRNSSNKTDDGILIILEPKNIESDFSDSMSIMEPVDEILAEITKESEQCIERSVNMIVNAKLPKLEFAVFKGNPLERQPFHDEFNILIHENKTLNCIDRFNYLKRYLAGCALATSGLTLNSENYKEALGILIDILGNPHVLKSVYMEILVKIKKSKKCEIFRSVAETL